MTHKKMILIFSLFGFLLFICVGFIIFRHAQTEKYSQSYIEEENADVQYVIYGSYPQSQVTDVNLLEDLNKQVLEWKSYGYYSGDGTIGSAVQSDYMRYADVIYNNNTYRAINLSGYRARSCHKKDSSSTQMAYLDISKDTVYWYLYEPIRWIVLNREDNLLLSEMVLDSQPINSQIYIKHQKMELDASEFYRDPDFKNLASDYYASDIRAWLNSSFFETAFSEKEAESIVYTDLDDSSWYSQYKKYNSKDHCDRVFLLSCTEATNPKNGFSARPEKCDLRRMAFPTDYAKSQGNWTHDNGACYWWLRTAVNNATSKGASLNSAVNFEGSVCFAFFLPYSPDSVDTGIRPAIRLDRLENRNVLS